MYSIYSTGSIRGKLYTDIDVNMNRIVNLGRPVEPFDAVRKADLDSIVSSIDTSMYLRADGSVGFTNDLNANFKTIKNLGPPIHDYDPIRQIDLNNVLNNLQHLSSMLTSDLNLIQNMQNQINSIRITVNQHASEISSNMSELSSVENSLASIQESIVNNQNNIVQLSDKYMAINSDISRIDNTLNNINSRLSSTEIRTEQNIVNINELRTSYSDISTALNQHVDSTGNPHHVSINDVLAESNTVNTDIDLGTNRLINIGAPVDKNDATNKQYVDNLISSITINVNDLHDYIDNHLSDISTDMTAINNHLSSIDNEYDSLNNQISTINNSISAINTHLTTLDNEYSDLTSLIDSINSNLNDLHDYVDTKFDEANSYTDDKFTTINTSLNNHINNISNPHKVTLAQLLAQNNNITHDINMNTNKLFNLPEPLSDTEPIRKIDLDNVLSTFRLHLVDEVTNKEYVLSVNNGELVLHEVV